MINYAQKILRCLRLYCDIYSSMISAFSALMFLKYCISLLERYIALEHYTHVPTYCPPLPLTSGLLMQKSVYIDNTPISYLQSVFHSSINLNFLGPKTTFIYLQVTYSSSLICCCHREQWAMLVMTPGGALSKNTTLDSTK